MLRDDDVSVGACKVQWSGLNLTDWLSQKKLKFIPSWHLSCHIFWATSGDCKQKIEANGDWVFDFKRIKASGHVICKLIHVYLKCICVPLRWKSFHHFHLSAANFQISLSKRGWDANTDSHCKTVKITDNVRLVQNNLNLKRWNGKASTSNCLRYSVMCNRPKRNVWNYEHTWFESFLLLCC